MNLFLFELWNDSTKTIRLLALYFYAVIGSQARNLIVKYNIATSLPQMRKMLTKVLSLDVEINKWVMPSYLFYMFEM